MHTHTHTHTHTHVCTHTDIYICVCVCGCVCIMNFSPSYFSVLFSQFAFFFELLWWSNFVKIATFGRCLFSQKSFVVGVQLVSKCVFAFYYISFKFSSAELFFLCSVDQEFFISIVKCVCVFFCHCATHTHTGLNFIYILFWNQNR